MFMAIDIKAPMPGIIMEILVDEGYTVRRDDELLILEAMKMENPIRSPEDGVAKTILVRKKDFVDTDQIIMSLE